MPEHASELEPGEDRKPYEKPAMSWVQDTDVRANLASACSLVGGSGDPICDQAPAS